MISWQEHREEILRAAAEVRDSGAAGSEELPLAQAHGRVLAADVVNAVDVPLFDNSAMDGFAVRAADAAAGARLEVVGDVPAGSSANPVIGAGQAVRIMTGAAVPDSADAIVPVEDIVAGPPHEGIEQTSRTEALPQWIEIASKPRPGAHIRRAGEDHRAGSVAVPAGAVLGPWQLAAAASANRSAVSAVRRPTVAVVSTGSELIAPGGQPGRGQIPESNSFLLASAVLEAGCQLAPGAPFYFADDDPQAVAEFFDRIGEFDAVVFSGGVSVGAFDIVKEVLAPRGVQFRRVAIQPGKPQGFGTVGSTLVFGLPGNPVSAATSFEVFVRPALLTLAGRSEVLRPTITARAAVGWHTSAGRAQVMPVLLEDSADGPAVRPAGPGGSRSHYVTSLAGAEHLAVIPADVDEVRAGDPVAVMMVS